MQTLIYFYFIQDLLRYNNDIWNENKPYLKYLNYNVFFILSLISRSKLTKLSSHTAKGNLGENPILI